MAAKADQWAAMHKLCHPTIRDGSTWSKFGARGEQVWGALVWVSSELAGRWFYSPHRLAARNGHQSDAEKFTNKENFESMQPDFLSMF